MRRQLIRNPESARVRLRCAGPALAALLMVLAPIAAARAVSVSEFALAGSGTGAELLWSEFEVAVNAALVHGSDSYEPDFGTAGLTVTGPFAAADGESGGMVFCWTAMARDPAYLISASSFFRTGGRSWIDRDKSLWILPDLGVVPGGNLSVFDTGAVDVISWNFLEFSCALLALRLEDYLRLKKVLERDDLDLDAQLAAVHLQLSPVPDPSTSLLMGQGLLILALLGPFSSPGRGGALPRPQGRGSRKARLPGR